MAALILAVLSLAAVVSVRQPALVTSNSSAAVPADANYVPFRRIYLAPGHEFIVNTAKGRTERVTSLLATPGRMTYGQYVWNDVGVPEGRVWVRVDLDRQLLSVFRSGQEIGTAVILYGARDTPTPRGWLSVLAKARYHYSKAYDAPMPYMLRLTADGVALHASVVREGFATHGCIGLPYAFASHLFDTMEVGDELLVVGKSS